jgi:hypothetical protein
MDTLQTMLKDMNDSAQAKASTERPTTIAADFNGVPLELITYFDVDIRKMDGRINGQLRDIFSVLSPGAKDIGDVLSKVRALDRKLGQPSGTETRYGRIASYLKISAKIDSLEKHRKAI